MRERECVRVRELEGELGTMGKRVRERETLR